MTTTIHGHFPRFYKDLTFKASTTTRHAFDAVRASSAHAPKSAPYAAPNLGTVEAIGDGRLEEWPSFVRESFGRLYRSADADAAPLPTPPSWAQRATRVMLDDPTMPELRAMCAGSRMLAADAAARIASGVAGVLDIAGLGKDADAAKEERAARNEVEALAELAESTSSPDIQQAAMSAGNTWKASAVRRNMLAGRADSPVTAAAVSNVMARVAAEVGAKAEAMAVARSFLGSAGVDDAVAGDEGVPTELAEAIMNDALLRQVLAMLGRMREDAKRGRLGEVPGAGNLDVVGVDLGDDAGMLVDDELSIMVAGGDEGETEVLGRLSEKRAMTWQRRREERSGDGDFTLCLDCSSSMAEKGGRPMATARAVALALVLDAVRAKRRVVLVTFASTPDAPIVIERGGRGLPQAIIAMGTAPHGGTDGVAALRAAVAVAKPGAKSRSDVAMVTDGEWGSDRTDLTERRDDLVRNGGAFIEVRVSDTDTTADVLESHPWMTDAVVVGVGDVAGAVAVTKLASRKAVRR